MVFKSLSHTQRSNADILTEEPQQCITAQHGLLGRALGWHGSSPGPATALLTDLGQATSSPASVSPLKVKGGMLLASFVNCPLLYWCQALGESQALLFSDRVCLDARGLCIFGSMFPFSFLKSSQYLPPTVLSARICFWGMNFLFYPIISTGVLSLQWPYSGHFNPQNYL